MKQGALKALVWIPEQPEKQREGELTFMDNTVQASAGTIKLRVTLKNDDRFFWAGQFVHVRLVLAMRKDAVLAPMVAMQVGQAGPFVYVVNGASEAELRPIKAGQRYGDFLMIEEGVKAGEQVVKTGHMMVMPGAKVMVIDPTKMPPMSPGGPASKPAAPETQGNRGAEQ